MGRGDRWKLNFGLWVHVACTEVEIECCTNETYKLMLLQEKINLKKYTYIVINFLRLLRTIIIFIT